MLKQTLLPLKFFFGIREGVIWVRPNTDEARETTQDMADDYVRMTVFEAKFQTPPHASELVSLLPNDAII